MIKRLSALLIAVILAAALTACASGINAPLSTETDNKTEITDTSYTDDTVSPPVSNKTTALTDDTAVGVKITIGDKSYTVILSDTDAAREFVKTLPLTLTMSELNGNEKYCYLDRNLPADSSCPSQINSGDLMLYGSNCLVLFYESFTTSYSYTPIGSIADTAGLDGALGGGSAAVTFEINLQKEE